MSASPRPDDISDVTCPFCGLVCDDLVLGAEAGRLSVRANGCALASTAFLSAGDGSGATARIRGRPASLPEAAAEAARLLRGARIPLIAGLATDVEGARAAGRLADRLGGVLDHMNSDAFLRNVRVLQDSGWITTKIGRAHV